MQKNKDVLIGCLSVITPLLCKFINNVFFIEEVIVIITVLITCVLLIAALICFLLSNNTHYRNYTQISRTDILVGVYLCLSLANIIFVKNWQIENIVILKWTTMFLVYILFRVLPDKEYVLYGLAISGIIQSFITIGQWAYMLGSNHRRFDVTGSFGNPGQLGGFLAITTVVSVGLLMQAVKQKKKVLSVCLGAGLALQLTAFYLADSRAGIVGSAIGLLVIFSHYLIQGFKKHKITSIVICTVAVVGIGIELYNHRPASADARLLIWRVSADMIKDKPVLGHGVASFNEEYMLYQAGYFKHNPDSRCIMVADNVAYPYNEFLHVWIEQGIIGLLILLALFGTVLFHRSSDPKQRTLKAGFLALIGYSMFSYPSYVFPLLLLYAIFLGSLESKAIFRFRIPKWSLAVAGFILIAVIAAGIKQIGFYHEASDKLKTLHSKNNKEAVVFIDNNYDKLKYNTRFNHLYSAYISEAEIAPQIRERINDLYSSCETWCDIGNIYTKEGEYGKAEQYYITASYMIPTRLKPNYYLWVLYQKSGDKEKAIQTANKILTQPLKVENTFTLRAKAEVREFLKNQ